MFIKLMPDQITNFWEDIKYGMIESYKIPEEFQQDFAINALGQLLAGLSQSWMSINIDDVDNRTANLFITTKILNEEYYGRKTLFVDSLYGLKLITDEMASEVYKSLESFAKANGCSMITSENSNERLKSLLLAEGFKETKTIYRKVLNS